MTVFSKSVILFVNVVISSPKFVTSVSNAVTLFVNAATVFVNAVNGIEKIGQAPLRLAFRLEELDMKQYIERKEQERLNKLQG